MSIATLKKKTQAQYNNMSAGNTQGFSLNGTLRNQGYVGQTSLSRSLPRTLMKGNVIKGHGGCCGNFLIKPIVQSAVTSLNNPQVIKPSVKNTDGMIETKYMWTNRPQKLLSLWKPNYNTNDKSHETYMKDLVKATLKADSAACQKPNTSFKPCCANADANLFNGPAYKPITKPESTYSAISQSEYLAYLTNGCVSDVSYNVAHNRQTPFACGISR